MSRKRQRFCPRNHDTWETGRYASYRCIVCTKEDARNREAVVGRTPLSSASRLTASEREKQWVESNPEKVRAYKKAYRDKPSSKAIARAYAQTPERKEKSRIANTKWRHANRQHVNQWCLARNRRTPPLPKADIDSLLEYYGKKCVYCGREATGFDHLYPVSKGGEHTIGNLAPACGSCNSRKSNHPIWVMVGA